MSKQCPVCKNKWRDDVSKCPIDDTELFIEGEIITSPPSQQQDEADKIVISPKQPMIQPVKDAENDSSIPPAIVHKKRKGFFITKLISKFKRTDPKKAYIEGVVRNFHEDIIEMNLIRQWLLALLKGCPFVKCGNICNFELLDTNGQVHSIIMYGKIIRGRFQEYSTIRVFGKWDRNNTMIARSMENLSSNSKVKVNKAISSNMVRVLSILVVSILYYLIFMVDYISLIETITASIMTFLSAVILTLLPFMITFLVLWFLIKKLFR
ncbi:hypothetical protein [Bacillus pseudomycoides]|uniref:hypothetical protein n=1 Tax=Bacillus pseudomycoides TaxID=64104 RepID=UPI003D6553A8